MVLFPFPDINEMILSWNRTQLKDKARKPCPVFCYLLYLPRADYARASLRAFTSWSASRPWTVAAASMDSPCDAGQPMHIIPLAKNVRTSSGCSLITSPMTISFVIISMTPFTNLRFDIVWCHYTSLVSGITFVCDIAFVYAAYDTTLRRELQAKSYLYGRICLFFRLLSHFCLFHITAIRSAAYLRQFICNAALITSRNSQNSPKAGVLFKNGDASPKGEDTCIAHFIKKRFYTPHVLYRV